MQPPVSVSNYFMDLGRSNNYRTLWEYAICYLRYMFPENEYGYKCYECDRPWFRRDLKVATMATAAHLSYCSGKL